MISRATLDAMTSACNFSQVGPIRAAGRAHARIQDGLPALAPRAVAAAGGDVDACEKACDTAMEEMGPVNIYQMCVFTRACASFVLRGTAG